MKYAEKAEKLFFDGLNCCQAVFLAFADLHGMPEQQALRLTAGMGGGIGRLREVCGAVSGMVLAAGLLMGPDDPLNADLKAEHYALVQKMVLQFKESAGSFIGTVKSCSQLGTPVTMSCCLVVEWYERFLA